MTKVFSVDHLLKHIPLLFPLVVFGVYLSTTAPVVYVGDSGELTAAAFSLSIPHPSGYPLFPMIGKMFCMVPFGNIGFRMNLMSGFFASLSALLVFNIIKRFIRNVLCSLSAALFLAFIPLFWSQTVSAEVYPLHCFFVAAMIRILLQWEENREFRWLLLFVFVTGLSFGNHLQTVMMAPPILYFIISGDRKVLFEWPNFLIITICFLVPLSLYCYLPIRTNAEAAIQWGAPDNLERFWFHVTAKSHRSSYIFSTGSSVYLTRFLAAAKALVLEYGFLLCFSVWGWMRLSSMRWKILFAGIAFLDLFYTLFLNIVPLEITPFGLPSTIVLAVLMGIGFKEFVGWADGQTKNRQGFRKGIALGILLMPFIAFIANYASADQKRNYTAYEHAVNIFRTTDAGSTIFIDGDNNVFPVAYGRIVEGMGEGITLNDRHNLLFKWRLPSYPFVFSGSWDELKSEVINRVLKEKSNNGVYFALFNPQSLSVVDGYRMAPYGILRKGVSKASELKEPKDLWDYYSTESYRDNFARDYMTREVTAHYFFRKGEDLWQKGEISEGMRFLNIASEIGYNDTSIHSDLGVFFADHGIFDKAEKELLKAIEYTDNLGGIHNNWGYYYHKKGDFEKAVGAFREAISLSPEQHAYYNNLGFTLKRLGRKKEAMEAFRQSIAIKSNQPEVAEQIRQNDVPFKQNELL